MTAERQPTNVPGPRGPVDPQPVVMVPSGAPIPAARPPGSAPCDGNPANPLHQLRTLDQFLERFPHLVELLRGPAQPCDRRTVAEVVDLYLADAKAGGLSPQALQDRTRTLTLFARELGARRVGDCLPLDLKHWVQAHAEWQSPWTRNRVNTDVQRCFNWAAEEMRLIRQNPFRGVHYPQGAPRRPMTDEEFRAILRHSPAHFRRLFFALRWTGCRPSELCNLQWQHVDWPNGVALLPDHKTRKRTGRPRVIVLNPPMVRLLRWLQRRRGLPAAVALARILARGPVRIKEVVRRMRAQGFSYRSLYKARLRLGARYRTVSGHSGTTRRVLWSLPAGLQEDPARPWGPVAKALVRVLAAGPVGALVVGERMTARGFSLKAVYRAARELGVKRRPHVEAGSFQVLELAGPAGDVPGEEDCDRYVFLNAYGGRWDRHALAHRLRRLRGRAGLPADCTAYTLRHKFGTDGVKNGLNLKVLATLMGHSQITTTSKHYVHVDNDFDLLREAAERVRRPRGDAGGKGGATP